MVSIIILSYNTQTLLKSCLSSIYSVLKGQDFEIIVVDNASTDSSVKMVKREFKQIHLVESTVNLGFSKGVNLGARHARGDYLLFLNSDTTIKEGTIQEVINLFTSDKKISVIGGIQVDSKGKIRVSSGKIYSIFNLPLIGFDYLTTYGKKFSSGLKEVEWVNGACMFITTDLFKKLGGFDENLFMYMEDMELCYRVRKMGGKVIVFNNFIVEHKEFGSSNREFAIEQIYKGILYFFKKHKNNVEYIMVKGILLVKAYIVIAGAYITGNKDLKNTYLKAMQGII